MLWHVSFPTLLFLSQFFVSGIMYAQDKDKSRVKFINQTEPTLITSGEGAIIKDYFKANITTDKKLAEK